MSNPTPIPPDELARLLALRDAMAEAMKPNDNAMGDWEAVREADGGITVCGPDHGGDPKRLRVAEMNRLLSVRERTALARFIVAAVNLALAECRAAKGKVAP